MCECPFFTSVEHAGVQIKTKVSAAEAAFMFNLFMAMSADRILLSCLDGNEKKRSATTRKTPMESKETAASEISLKKAVLMEDLARIWADRIASGPGAGSLKSLAELVILLGNFLSSLKQALTRRPWDIASFLFKDSVKAISFLGGWLAEHEAGPSAACLLLPHLRQSIVTLGFDLDRESLDLLDALGAAAAETFHCTAMARQKQRYQEMLLTSTPIFRLPENVPCALLLGDPARETVGELLNRVLVEAVRDDARFVIVDIGGLCSVSEGFADSFGSLIRHKRMCRRRIILSGASDETKELLRRRGVQGENLAFASDLGRAMKTAR